MQYHPQLEASYIPATIYMVDSPLYHDPISSEYILLLEIILDSSADNLPASWEGDTSETREVNVKNIST